MKLFKKSEIGIDDFIEESYESYKNENVVETRSEFLWMKAVNFHKVGIWFFWVGLISLVAGGIVFAYDGELSAYVLWVIGGAGLIPGTIMYFFGLHLMSSSATLIEIEMVNDNLSKMKAKDESKDK